MFIPSPEQQRIFDAVLTTRKNYAIRAGAGSGKTTTVQQLAKRLPVSLSKCYCAFNKDIVTEVEPKIQGTGMVAKTFHSLGYGALAGHLAQLKKVKSVYLDAGKGKDKYKKIITAWAEGSSTLAHEIEAAVKIEEIEDFSSREKRKKSLFKETVSMLIELTRFARLKLTEWDDFDKLRDLAEYYDLINDLAFIDSNNRVIYHDTLIDLAIKTVPSVMKESERRLCEDLELDFTDMIYWVVRWDLSIKQFDFVFVDECQDLSPMQRAMVKKAIKGDGGRIVLVGDERQAIYEFAGADSNSFDLSVEMFNAEVLPLSVTRRSAKVIVQHANTIVPNFYALDTAPRGKIVWIDEDRLSSVAAPGDMIICRVRAPLVKACIGFIAAGKPATILGNDIGRALIKIIEKLQSREGYTFQTILDVLDAYEEEQVAKYVAKEDEQQASNFRDQCEAVRVVIESAKAYDYYSLVGYIERLFSDNGKDNVIILATGHKSKGLEAERVFILAPEKMPLKFPNQRQESLIQEANIEYVAITRAKHTLVYLTNPTFIKNNDRPPYVQTSFDDLNWDEPVKSQMVIGPEEEYGQNEEALNDLIAHHIHTYKHMDEYKALVKRQAELEPIVHPSGDDELDEILETGPDFLERPSYEPEYDDDDLEEEEDFDFIPTPLTAEPPYVPALWGPMDEEIEDPLLGLFEEDDEPEPVRLFVQPKGDSSVQVILPAPSVISKLKKAMIEFDAPDYHDTVIWAAAADYIDLQRHEPIEYPYTIEERYGVHFGSDWMPAPAPSVTPVTPAFRASRELSTDLKTFSVVKTKERLMLMIGDMSEADLKRAAQLLDKEFKSKEAPAASQPSLL
jgi:superfamily I DNA/RNA helicase